MRYWLTIGAAALLAACGEAGSPGGADPAAGAGEEKAVAAPAAVSATREDVVEAIQCHLAVSGIMASEITSSASPRRIGPAVRYWHGLIGARAKAAGMSETEAEALRKQVVGEQMTERDTEQSKAFGEQCYARAPKE